MIKIFYFDICICFLSSYEYYSEISTKLFINFNIYLKFNFNQEDIFLDLHYQFYTNELVYG